MVPFRFDLVEVDLHVAFRSSQAPNNLAHTAGRIVVVLRWTTAWDAVCVLVKCTTTVQTATSLLLPIMCRSQYPLLSQRVWDKDDQ